MPQVARRVAGFGTTIFTTVNTLAAQHQAINLGQGAPNFEGPASVRQAYADAVLGGAHNQYPPGPGTPTLREAVAAHARRFYNLDVDPARGVCVTAGATEAIFASVQSVADPGDEVIVLEPYFDCYVPAITMGGAVPVYVPLVPGTWRLDADALRAAFGPRTRALILNTPHNPTGRVFDADELALIAALCVAHDVVCISDEVYEHITFPGTPHTPVATLPGMWERTITCSSGGKTFSATGWKIGWVWGHPDRVQGVWQARQFITFAVNHPGQIAVAHGLALPDAYYDTLAADYLRRRNLLLEALDGAGLRTLVPEGSFFAMADFSGVFDGDDVAFTQFLIEQVGVACIPPSSFYSDAHRAQGQRFVRFAFCKTEDTLHAAAERLVRLRQRA